MSFFLYLFQLFFYFFCASINFIFNLNFLFILFFLILKHLFPFSFLFPTLVLFFFTVFAIFLFSFHFSCKSYIQLFSPYFFPLTFFLFIHSTSFSNFLLFLFLLKLQYTSSLASWLLSIIFTLTSTFLPRIIYSTHL